MLSFFVHGAPQGKGRARAFKTRSGHIGHYTPEKTRTYEGIIRSAALDAMDGREILNGAVYLSLLIVMPVPSSWPKWKQALAEEGRVAPTTKPDSDNVEKAIKDALNGVVWVDDCQVTHGEKSKVYVSERFPAPGVNVSVKPLSVITAQQKTKPKECE